MARPFRIGATGGLGCSRNPDQSPQLGNGTCRLYNVPLEGLGRRRLATSRGSKSGRTHQHSRSYLGPAIKRWTPREVSMNGGRGSVGDLTHSMSAAPQPESPTAGRHRGWVRLRPVLAWAMDHFCGKHQRMDRLRTTERGVVRCSIPSHAPMGTALDLVGPGARLGGVLASYLSRWTRV